MAPPNADRSEGTDPDRVLQRVEERVQKVRHLEPFRFSRREDGRFQCELEKPIRDLEPEEIRQALSVLDSLTGALRARLEEIETE